MTTCPPAEGPGFDQPSQALAGPAPSPLADCPARPPRSAPGRPLAPASLPAPLRAAALLGLALLAAAPPAQAAKPVLRTTNPVTTSGSQVTLHYDQTLASTKTPLGSQFTVTVGGQQVAPNVIQASGIEVRVFVGFHIAPDEAVTIAYSKPTSGVGNDPIQNSAGEEADSFSAKTATTSETWSATALDAAASQSTVSGDRVAIFFNAELDSSPSFQVPAGAFTVTVDGTEQTPGARNYVPSFTGGKGVIILRTLPTAIKSGQTVQVSYAPPLGAGFTVSRNRLWGSDGKLVQRFADQTITNNTALVANIGTDTQTTRTFSFDHAQAFTTGSRAIRLDAANLRVSKGMGRDDPDYTVSIHSSNASDQPGDSLGTLTNPAALPTTPGSTRFEAPSAGITLAAATTYFVVIDVTVDGNQDFAQANVTDSDDEDAGKTTDWSIADALLSRGAGHTNWGADTQSPPRSLVIGVQGAPAAPTLVSAAVNDTALTLTFNAKLAAGSVPAASAFTVSGGRTGTGTVTINSTDPRVVSVTLDSAVAQTDTALTVSYTKPASSPLKDTCDPCAGANSALEVATFSGKAVKNDTPEPTLVGNTAQTEDGGTVGFGTFSGVNWSMALPFTTGTNTAGYTLSAVDVKLASGTHSANTQVSIYNTSSGSPSTSLHVLTNPSSLTASATNTFTAAGDELAANTTYAVVFEITSGSGQTRLPRTQSDGEDSGKASGWSIGNKRHEKQGTGSWSEATDAGKMKIAIKGTAKTATPPPATTPVVSIARVGASVSEGGSAAFRVSALPVPASNLTVGLTISQTGSFVVAGGTGSKTVTVPTSGSATYSVATVDDSTDEANGSVRATLSAPAVGAGYTLHTTASQRTASVTVTDDDPTPPGQDPPPDPPDPQNPQDASGGREQRPRDPQPLQLALWTDKPGYRPGETVRLYRSLEPHDDRGRYRAFAWLEPAGGGERRWLAPLSAEGQLHAEAVDSRGQPASAASPQALSAADRELAFEGEAPGPGLWQFVLELRPGEPSEQSAAPAQPLRTRRAWAKFAVAQRSVLLNRSGFDREIRSDMTLRADTLYYLGHQMFVRAGATLAIEPGTLLQAFGSHAAIIVEPGGRIVAEGTREAPVVLTCSAPAGYRHPGCWAGLRILGNAPVTRLEGVAPGVLPPERPAYGGSDGEGSSGALRYVRVEFAGASGDPEAPGPAIGLYGAGSGTVLDHVQARQSLGDAFAFHGGTAVCDHCVASGSGGSGLSWQRGWQGGAAHLYVQHGRGGGDGLSGGHDEQGHDREPRSLPTLSNLTLVHAAPYDRRARRAVAVRLSDGTAVQLRDLLAAHFGGGALRASGRSRLLFGEGESSLIGALLWLNGSPQVPAGIAEDADFEVRDPKLRDVRDFADPDPRPKADSHALTIERKGYIGAFGRSENWLKEWTVFGPESVYDIRQRSEDEN